MTPEQKFEQWAMAQLRHNIDKTIVGNEQEGWKVFGRYDIVPQSPIYEVWFGVNFVGKFGSKRSALSWCIADKHKQLGLSQQIKNLDSKKQMIDNDVAVSQQLQHKTKSLLFKETVMLKLQPKLLQKDAVSAQLEKCISQAKYLQLKGFSNETARTSHA